MRLPRQDVHCPACPDTPEAFVIRDVGMKIAYEGDPRRDDSVTVRVSRPGWEVPMLHHLRMNEDEAHQQLYRECAALLNEQGLSAQQAAAREVDAAADFFNRTLREATAQRPTADVYWMSQANLDRCRAELPAADHAWLDATFRAYPRPDPAAQVVVDQARVVAAFERLRAQAPQGRRRLPRFSPPGR